uniref:Uncharacterized protein n=1 Tax=Anguilla anguilla TaxID=7936 RepID=A0A0E9WK22_ANGAN
MTYWQCIVCMSNLAYLYVENVLLEISMYPVNKYNFNSLCIRGVLRSLCIEGLNI